MDSCLGLFQLCHVMYPLLLLRMRRAHWYVGVDMYLFLAGYLPQLIPIGAGLARS